MNLTEAEQLLFKATGLVPRKICISCNEHKEVTAFGGDRRGGRKEICRACFHETPAQDRAEESIRLRKQRSLQYQMRRRSKNKAIVLEVKSKGCTDCKKPFAPEQLDLDHIPERGEKLGNISQLVRTASTKKLLEELKKCDPVCATCHRARTESRRAAAARQAHDAVSDYETDVASATELRLSRLPGT